MLIKTNSSSTICPENELENADGRTLMQFLCGSLAVLWKDWKTRMAAAQMSCSMLSQQNQFSLTGECPHCNHPSVFTMPPGTLAYEEPRGSGQSTLYAVMRCSGCLKYILGVALKQGGSWLYLGHYPLGSPDDAVDPNVPTSIASDFSEALRCFWVKSYKATVAMCGRGIQASAISLGAKGQRLIDQIDDLANHGKITQPLRDMAHEIRLARNVGAHPDKDGLKDVGEKDADDIVEFTREYFHHVYVMPAKLEARRKKEAAAEEKPPG